MNDEGDVTVRARRGRPRSTSAERYGSGDRESRHGGVVCEPEGVGCGGTAAVFADGGSNALLTRMSPPGSAAEPPSDAAGRL